MRIWYPIPPFCCDGPRLLGMHREIHTIERSAMGIIEGWRNHPEVKRWVNHLPALTAYHDMIVEEAARRGWSMGLDHKTPMVHEGPIIWPEPWETIEVMRSKLAVKIRTKLEAAR